MRKVALGMDAREDVACRSAPAVVHSGAWGCTEKGRTAGFAVALVAAPPLGSSRVGVCAKAEEHTRPGKLC